MRILSAAVFLLATPAIAADDTAPAVAKEKKVCRASELTGSRLGGKTVCKTQAEWEADRLAHQRDLDKRSRGN